MSYNMSFMDNQTSIINIVDGVNNASGSMIGIFLLMIVWIATLSLAKTYDFVTRWLIANFMTLIIGVLLYFIGWVSWIALTPVIAMLVTSIIVYFYT